MWAFARFGLLLDVGVCSIWSFAQYGLWADGDGVMEDVLRKRLCAVFNDIGYITVYCLRKTHWISFTRRSCTAFVNVGSRIPWFSIV